MSFFRSAALRRIVYAIVIAVALVRLSTRLHSEPLIEGGVPTTTIVQHIS